MSELQSCVCTKDNNHDAISTQLSSSISYSCGSTASEDLTSANIVYSAYCTPDEDFDLPTPTTNIMSQMVTDRPEVNILARCAQSALSYAVATMVGVLYSTA